MKSQAASETLEVRVGETVEIASSSGYCYYPTVHRFQNGEVFATIRMSADDTIPESEFSAYSISTDRGLFLGVQSSKGMRTISWPQHTFLLKETRDTDGSSFCVLQMRGERGASTQPLRRSSPARIHHPGGVPKGRTKRRSYEPRIIACSRFFAREAAVQMSARRDPPTAERPGPALNRRE